MFDRDIFKALIKILDNLSSFRGESRFTTWAHKICVRTAFAEMRRSRWRDVSLNTRRSFNTRKVLARPPTHWTTPNERRPRVRSWRSSGA